MTEVVTVNARPIEVEEVEEKRSNSSVAQYSNLKGLQGSIAIKAHEAATKIAAKVLAAQALPRNMQQIEDILLEACEDPIFAEQAIYAKPVTSSSVVEGLNHWFAKFVASIWCNFDWESIEHTKSQSEKQTQIQVVCWDIEKNSTHSESVIVLHKKAGTNTDAFTSDEIRQEVNRQKSILERNCLLDCFPKSLIQRCEEKIFTTLDKKASAALVNPLETIKLFAKAFSTEQFPVTEHHIFSFLKISDPKHLKPTHVRRLTRLKALANDENENLDLKKVFGKASIEIAEINKAAETAKEETAKEDQKRTRKRAEQAKEEQKAEEKDQESAAAQGVEESSPVGDSGKEVAPPVEEKVTPATPAKAAPELGQKKVNPQNF